MTSWGSADRLSHNPGIFGGYYGPPNPRFVIRNTDLMERLQADEDLDIFSQFDLMNKQQLNGEYIMESSSTSTQQFAEGDVFAFSLGGGGGYGDVLEREPESVLEDIQTDISRMR